MIDYKHRLVSIAAEIDKKRVDAFLVTNGVNVSYLSGFEDDSSLLLITPKKKFFITDSRFIEEAHDRLRGKFEIELVETTTYAKIKELARRCHLQRIGFESMNLPYGALRELKVNLGGRARLVPFVNTIEDFRAIKDQEEIEFIRGSIRLAKTVLNKITRLMKSGRRERSLSDRIEVEFINAGARPSFPPIVASGVNSSKPHAKVSDARIAGNTFVMVDIGCCLNGYNCDMTRMVLLGRVKDRFKKIYNIVLEAQRRAFAKIKPGARISTVDIAARSYIEGQSFGRYFGHSLGHGIGLEVHEEPMISKTNQDALKPGMVFSVEPAIYIPKFGGVRSEDMVLVTDKGYEVLTR